MLLLAVSAVALAATIPPGTPVLVDAIGAEDGFYAHRDVIVGHACTAETALQPSVGEFVAGRLACDDSRSYSFYQVKVTVTAAPATNAPGTIPAGARVTIRGVSPLDSYASSAADWVGASCQAIAPLVKENGWFGGELRCDGKEAATFYQVALDVTSLDQASPTFVGKPGEPGTKLKKGAAVRVVGVHRVDPASADAASLLGRECRARTKLTSLGDGWWAGALRCGETDVAFVGVGIERL
jgi:hypothetical protein